MHHLPPLPPGYVAQPMWLKSRAGRHYEFSTVYDPHGHRDPALSYWAVLTPGATELPEIRSITFRRLRDALGRRAPSFAVFSSYLLPIRQIDDWIEMARSPRETETALAETATTPELLPWNYLGLRVLSGAWVPVSGYVPSDGDDVEESAREAAWMLQADAVVLRNARGDLVSVRDRDGKRITGLEGIVGSAIAAR